MSHPFLFPFGAAFGMIFLVSGLYIFFGKQEIEADNARVANNKAIEAAADREHEEDAVRARKSLFRPFGDDDTLHHTFKADESDPTTYGHS